MNTNNKNKSIFAIEKGTGENSTYFKVNDPYLYAPFGNRIVEIVENKKSIHWDCDLDDKYILVYRGYDKDGKLLFEIEANSSLTIYYEKI